MTVTTRFGSSAFDPTVLPYVPLEGENSQGKIRRCQSYRSIPIGEAPGDLSVMGRVNSNARIQAGSKASFGAVTGITSMDVGLYQEKSLMVPDTTKGAAACLVSAKDVHLAGTFNFDAIPIASSGMPAWQLAGLSADPGGFMLIVTTIHAAGGTSSAAADFNLDIDFRDV